MAKTLFRSPGVSTREIDLSAPGQITPQGIPAGVVGTSKTGPAFVPTVFATANEFINKFGDSEAKYFGAIAVKEWMRNARAGLYLRVLGIGDGSQADSSTNVTTRAGFFVGEKIRNQSDTTAEFDGSAIARSVNPYAGAALPTKILTVDTPAETAAAGAVKVDADAEESELTFVDSFVGGIAAYDGIYLVLQGATAATKWIVWLDSQGNRGKTDNGDGTTAITDGDFTIATINHTALGSSHAQIALIDISNVALNDQYKVAQEIASQINLLGGAGAVFSVAALNGTSDLVATIVNATVGEVDASTSGTSSSNVVADVLSIAQSVQGVTAVTEEAFVSTAIKFDTVPYDGTTITIKDHVGATTKTIKIGTTDNPDIDTTGMTTNDEVIVALFNYIAAPSAPVALSNATDGLGATNFATFDQHANVETVADSDLQVRMVQVGGDESYLIIKESAASISLTKSLPTVTLSESAPGAPGGRTMFLAAQMKPASDSVDLFGSGQTDVEDGKKVLRGVVMFASGVMPGLAEKHSVDNRHESVSASSVAFGEYGATKDLGSHTGYLDDDKFVMILNGFNNSDYSSTLTGSFDPESPVYFSKVLNTDPTKLQERGHYLYAHYDIPSGLASLAGDGNNAFLDAGAYNPHTESASDLDAGFYSATDVYKPSFENWREKFSHAFTPWITSQTLGNARKKLFRFHMLDAGMGGHNKVKISVANISKSTDSSSSYGSFDIQIRAASDVDKDPVILEQHVGLSLNPSSDKYIARIIGDQNTFFEFEKAEGKQKLVTEGLYPNRSQYVRVEVVDQVESGQMEASALPIGFQGKHHLVLGGGALANHSIIEPPLPLRQSVSVGQGTTLTVDSAFYWGSQSQDVRTASQRNKEAKIVSLVANLTKWFPSVGGDKAWIGDNANAQDKNGEGQDANVYNSNEFSLEKVWVQCKKNSTSGLADTSLPVDPTQWREAVYIRDGNENGYKPYSASLLDSNQAAGTDFYQSQEIINDNAAAGSKKSKRASNGWRYLDVSKDFGENASKKYFKFTVPMQGGWDGLDKFDKDKAEMNDLSAFREMSSNTSSDLGGAQGPTTAAFRKAIDILAEKSDVDIQVLATPGMRSSGITDYAIDRTEDRFDALYIMDMASFDNDQNVVKSDSQYVNVTNTVNEFAGRNLDSSFAAAYFPDIVIQDGDFNVVVPPSVGVLGALSLNDAVSHPWYAPAGQARGALSTVVETAVKLNRSNMDVLYEADINPITSFPNQGNSVMIFGQKTLLQAQSSLDRVNVRRLLIDIRRKVRNVANTILFEPNREATLARFSSLVNPILGRIQQQQGLDRFKVVIDTTTTTQQDIENNTIRGKIFLQPTRSIEFISLDFVVTNTGAEI